MASKITQFTPSPIPLISVCGDIWYRKFIPFPPEFWKDLRNGTAHECQQISSDILHNVRENFEQLFYYCMETNGEQFQHLI